MLSETTGHNVPCDERKMDEIRAASIDVESDPEEFGEDCQLIFYVDANGIEHIRTHFNSTHRSAVWEVISCNQDEFPLELTEINIEK